MKSLDNEFNTGTQDKSFNAYLIVAIIELPINNNVESTLIGDFRFSILSGGEKLIIASLSFPFLYYLNERQPAYR